MFQRNVPCYLLLLLAQREKGSSTDEAQVKQKDINCEMCHWMEWFVPHIIFCCLLNKAASAMGTIIWFH